jgi:urea transport system substrate-binding protein
MDKRLRHLSRAASRRGMIGAFAAVSLAAAVAGCGSASGSGSSTGPITIGLIAPQTGSTAEYGKPMTNAVTLAVDQINQQGGVGGRKLRVITVDDASDPRVTVDVARRLTDQDHVDAIFGTFSGIEFAPALKVATQAHTIFFFPTYGSAKGQPCGNVLVNLGQKENQQDAPWVPHLLQTYGRRFYFVGTNYPYPQFVASHLKQYLHSLGGQLVGEDWYPFGTTDFSKSLEAARQARANVMFSAVFGPDLFTFAKQYHQFGLNAELASPGYDNLTAPALAGVITGAETDQSWFASLANPANKAFIASYVQRFGNQNLDAVAEALYDGVHLYAAAVKLAGSTDLTKVRRALTQVSFNAPQGQVRITDSGLGLAMVTNSVIGKVAPNGHINVVKNLGPVPARNTGEANCSE